MILSIHQNIPRCSDFFPGTYIYDSWHVIHGVKFLEGFWVLVTPHLSQLPTVHVTKYVLITYGLVQHKAVSS